MAFVAVMLLVSITCTGKFGQLWVFALVQWLDWNKFNCIDIIYNGVTYNWFVTLVGFFIYSG